MATAETNPPADVKPLEVLQKLQTTLQLRYDVSVPYCVSQFVCCNAKQIHKTQNTEEQQPPHQSPEMLFYRQDGDNLDVSLFIESELLDQINQSHYRDWSDHFNDYCIALEGVSHFLYLVWNAHYDRQVSLLDLELQAEVDKFVFALLDTECNESSEELLKRLFEQVSYRDELTPELQERYEKANDFAYQYCRWLRDNFTLSHPNQALTAELARFYRLNGAAKQRHITQHMH